MLKDIGLQVSYFFFVPYPHPPEHNCYSDSSEKHEKDQNLDKWVHGVGLLNIRLIINPLVVFKILSINDLVLVCI